MINLLKIEIKKIATNKTFWVLVLLYALLTCIVIFGIQEFINTFASDIKKNAPIKIPPFSVYRFPDVWHNLTYLGGYFKIFLAVIIIILITNEFSFKTVRQNIISGLSRNDFVIGKLITVTILSIGAALLIFIIGFILGLFNTEHITFSRIFSRFEFIFAYFLEVYTYLLFALLIGFLVKKSGLAIGLLLLYAYVVKPIVKYKLPDNWDRIMPLDSVSNLVQTPNSALMRLFGFDFKNYIPYEDVLITIGYGCIFIFLIFLIIKKQDL